MNYIIIKYTIKSKILIIYDYGAADMKPIYKISERTVPISLFSQGKACKIFNEVKEAGPEILIKNNKPECVLISPKEYDELLQRIEDLELALLAEKRLSKVDKNKLISQKNLMNTLQISQKDLDEIDEIELE